MHNDVLARSVAMYTSFLVILIPEIVYQYKKQKITIIAEILIILIASTYFLTSLSESAIIPYKIQTSEIIFSRSQ